MDDPLVAAITYLASPETGPAELQDVVGAPRAPRPDRRGGAVRGRPARRPARRELRAARRGTLASSWALRPLLPAPDDCVDPRDAPAPCPADDLRPRRLPARDACPGGSVGKPNGDPTAELWQRLAGGREIDFPALAFLCDAYAPPVLELGELGSMTVQLTVHLHRAPVPGLDRDPADHPARRQRLPRGGLRALGRGRQPGGAEPPARDPALIGAVHELVTRSYAPRWTDERHLERIRHRCRLGDRQRAGDDHRR